MARYKMYVDGNLFYSPYSDSLNVLSAKVTLNQNAASTFEFQIPSTNTYINSFTRMSSAVTVYRDDVLLFSGIVCEDEIGWDNSKTVRCKDDIYRLSQSVMRPHCYGKSVDGTKIIIDANGDEQEVTTTTTETISVANFFKHLIANHNAMSSFKFAVGTVNVTGANVFESSSYTDTWSVISSLIDSYGGYIRLRYSGSINYIDWLTDFTDTSSQQIIYGENLLDYTSDTDGLDLATRLIPTGATIESTKIITVDGDEQEIPVSEVVTIKSVNGGLDYIQDSSAVSTYGVITVHQEWPEIEDPSALLTAAREYLKEIVYHTRNITIKAVDMISVDEYQTAFAMHKYIRVISSPHNIDDLYLPMTMEIDLFNPSNNTIDLSTTTTTSTGSSEVRSARSASGGFVSSVTKNLNTLQDNVNANKGTFNDLKAKSATFEDLKAVNAEIETLSAEKADIADLEANYAHITNGVIDNATIDHASVNGLSANYATITNLNAQKARIDTIVSTYVKTETLEADYIDADTIAATYATLTELHTNYVDANYIDAHYVDVDTLEADYIDADEIAVAYIKADASNMTDAVIRTVTVNSGLFASDATVNNGRITGYLDATKIRADSIVANSIKLLGDDGLYYQLNTQGVTTESGQTLKNALDGSHILADSITASKISVTDLYAFNATLGGFTLDSSSFHTQGKNTYNDATVGLYFGSDGKIGIGGSASNHIFYNASTGQLEITLDTLYIGSSNVATSINTANTNASNAVNTANTASDNASTALTNANNAKKVATSYIAYEASTGLMIANMIGSEGQLTPSGITSGRNVLITPTSVDIRNGQTVLASYGDSITIGNNSNYRITIDTTNGLKIGSNVQIDTSGNASFSGSITSTSGKIGGWTIGTASLNSYTLNGAAATSSSYDTHVYFGNGTNTNRDILVVNLHTSSTDKYPVVLRTNGYFRLYDPNGSAHLTFDPSATNVLTVNGHITATTGKIGVFNLNSALYTSSNSFGTVANNIYIGSSGISLGTTFKVTAAGALTATSGTIGGWNIGTDSLYSSTTSSGTTNSVYIYTSSNTSAGVVLSNATSSMTYRLALGTKAMAISRVDSSNYTTAINLAPNYMQMTYGSTAANTVVYMYVNGGNLTMSSTITAGSEICSKATASSGGNFRAISGNYGTILRNDGSNFNILLTDSGNATGTWNSLRPLTISLSGGGVSSGTNWDIYSSANKTFNIRSTGGTADLNITTASSHEARVTVNNGVHAGKFQSSSGNNLGIYDNTNSKWVVYSNSSGTVTVNTSDRRAKNYIQDTTQDSAIDLLRSIKIRQFTYKDDEHGVVTNGIFAQDIRDYLISNNMGYRSYLNIQGADENEEIYYDLTMDENKVQYGLEYQKFVPELWLGWQYHDDKLATHDTEIDKLKKRIVTLELLLVKNNITFD